MTTITPAMVRRFPFAVNPARITAEDEEAIAADMLARVVAERNGNPGAMPGPGKTADRIAGRNPDLANDEKAKRAAERREALARRIGGKIVRAADVAKWMKITRNAARARLADMTERGMLEMIGTDGTANLYRRREAAE